MMGGGGITHGNSNVSGSQYSTIPVPAAIRHGNRNHGPRDGGIILVSPSDCKLRGDAAAVWSACDNGAPLLSMLTATSHTSLYAISWTGQPWPAVPSRVASVEPPRARYNRIIGESTAEIATKPSAAPFLETQLQAQGT